MEVLNWIGSFRYRYPEEVNENNKTKQSGTEEVTKRICIEKPILDDVT